MRTLCILLMTFAFAQACIQKEPKAESISGAITSEEVQIIRELTMNQYDSIVNLFKMKGNKIPIEIYSAITEKSVDTTYDISSISSLEHLVNESTEQFVFKLDCMAGGNCCRYELLELKGQGIIRHKLIGLDMSSLDHQTEFSYTISENRIVELKEHTVKFVDNEVVEDTVIVKPFI